VIKLSDHIFSGVASAINAEMLETSAQISGDAFGGTLKIDFADYSYDVDGDGSNDSCSGTASITSTTYACFRAWFNDTRFMIGYIQTAPTSATVGEGKAIISPTIVANATVMEELGMSDDVMIYLDWSNTAEGATDLDCYVAGELMDVEGREVNLTVARNFVNSTTATGGVDKITLWTVAYMATPQVIGVPILGQDNVTNFDVDLIYFNSQFLLNGQYLTFQNDFYYEGVQVDGTPNNEIFCGEIATGDQAGDSPGDPTLCEGEGLDITELEYLELSASDVTKTQFPEATIFSEAPTF
jgi:hypothetical protein